ncbi:MAG: HEAT repeat domain-containing protein [Gammaproteobacteria bacterium]|nr:HEAT repeat domain-containing protein [Gammaproteobacteria bacterium]
MGLLDKEEEVRKSAAYALGNIGPAAQVAMPALINILQDEDKIVRESAAKATGFMKKLYWFKPVKNEEFDFTDAVPALITALKDEAAAVRRTAATALGLIGRKSQIAAI